MDTTKICVTKVEPKKDICNKKQNLLIYDKKNPCVFPAAKTNVYTAGPIATAAVKKIKVCTGADLKRMCPPKLCACAPKKTFGFLGSLFRLVGTGAKCVVAGGIVYFTYQTGIWGPSDNTEKMFSNMCQIISPAICTNSIKLTIAEEEENRVKEICKGIVDTEQHREKHYYCKERQEKTCIKVGEKECCSHPPSISHNTNRIKETWNKGVTGFFYLLVHGPGYICKLLKGEEKKEVKEAKNI